MNMIANILSLLTLTQGAHITKTTYKYTTITVYPPIPTGYEYDLSNSTSGINGTFPNGTFVNSTSFNGTYPNGTYANGTFVNSTSFNGTYPNGTYPNGTYANGTFANGTAHNVTLGNLTNYANSTALTSEIYTAVSTYETSPEVPQYAEVSLTSETPEPVPETTTEAPALETTTESPAPESTTEQPVQTTDSQPSQSGSQNNNQDNSQQLDSFAQGIIDYHNSVRAEHSAPALTWNQDLANFAQSYLNGTQCNFAHSGGPYGENIALGYSINDAMDAWYDEYQQYDYGAGQFSSAVGHFTQMVWKDTTEVGCATIHCDGWGPYLACEYTPRGNIIGEFTSNVFAN